MVSMPGAYEKMWNYVFGKLFLKKWQGRPHLRLNDGRVVPASPCGKPLVARHKLNLSRGRSPSFWKAATGL